MVGEAAVAEPPAPALRRPVHPLECLVDRLRRLGVAPGECDEGPVALTQRRAGACARALEAEAQTRVEPQPECAVAAGRGSAVVAGTDLGPPRRRAPVVEHRLAVHGRRDGAVHALERAQEHAVGLSVARGPALLRRAAPVAPRTEQERVAHHEKAAPRHPARLDDHAAEDVSLTRRHVDAGRADAEAAGASVEQRAEDARRVEGRQAQPLEVAARRQQRADLLVGKEREVADRRELRLVGRDDRRGRRVLPLGNGARHGRAAEPGRKCQRLLVASCSARTTCITALINARCVKACG
jgi:hypothetical protein